jgi:hypothetical protein
MTDAPFHDTGYKALFSLPELVQQLIEGFVTPDIAQLLDFSTLELVAGSFVTPAMQSREEDVVWRVKMADTTLYLYLLLEFQSTPDAAMPVRMVQYVAALYDSLIKEKRVDPRRLPPVLPVVLYNGERRWRVATDVGEAIECPPVLRAYQPRLRYYLLDEGAYSDHELAGVRNVVAGIFALENAQSKEEALAVVGRISEALRGMPGRERIDRVLTQWVKRYLQRVHPGAMMGVEESLETGEGTMLATNVQKWAEALLREGVQQGLQEGMQQGLQQGLQEGMQQGLQQGMHCGQHEGKVWALRQLLRVRFPDADLTPYQSRLDAATDAELEHLLTKAATAATLDAVFATE